MAKLCIALSAVLIFASTADGKLESWNQKIKSVIDGAILEYNTTMSKAQEFRTNLLDRLKYHASSVSAGVFADLQNRTIQFQELFDNNPDVAESECNFLTERLYQMADQAVDALKTCIVEQLSAVNADLMEIKKKVNNELDVLAGYKASAEKCYIDNAGSNFRIRRCVKTVARELYKLPRIDFSAEMKDLTNWISKCEVMLDSCTAERIDLYYKHSELIIEEANKCLDEKRETEIGVSLEAQELELKNETATEK